MIESIETHRHQDDVKIDDDFFLQVESYLPSSAVNTVICSSFESESTE